MTTEILKSNLEVGTGFEMADFSHLNRESSREEYALYGRFLGKLYALPDGTPVPPAKVSLCEAARSLGGPGLRIISDALGGITDLQEISGFVTANVAARWDNDKLTENGKWLSHMLGSPESPKPIKKKHLEQGSAVWIAPSVPRIRRVFGSIDGYNDALGFVTQATLKRWTDQDWIDNGVWLSHMLGSPEEPKMLSKADIELASSLGVGPSLPTIYEKYKSIPNYQRALGFEPRSWDINYTECGKDTYIENGIWLSHSIGTPEHPVLPTERLIKQASKLGLCPPFTAIIKRFGRSLFKYQDALGFVSQATLKRWTDKDWIDNGIWLSHMLGSPEKPKMPTREDIDKASAHGIAPTKQAVADKFGSIYDYQEALGFYNPNANQRITNRDLLKRGYRLIRAYRRPLELREYKAEGLPARLIQKRFHSVGNFHARLDIEDHRGPSPEKHLATGIRWAVEHGGEPASYQQLITLYEQGKGPDYSRIYKDFGSYENYKEAVIEGVAAYNALHESVTEIFGGKPELATHLLYDFRVGSEYQEDQINLADDLMDVSRRDKVAIARLYKMFERSRLTTMWDEDDFIEFGKRAIGSFNYDVEDCKAKLALVSRARLAPYPDEITDVFGSEEEFIDRVVFELLFAYQRRAHSNKSVIGAHTQR